MENEQVVRNYQNKHLLSTPLYTDMAGGLNTRVSPAQMAVNQSGMSRNVIYNAASGAVSARDGTVEYNPLAIPLAPSSGISAFLQARYSGGAWRYIAIGGSDGSVAAYALNHPTGNAWTAASHASVTKVPASRRTSACFYNDVVVCFDGVNNPYKLYLDSADAYTFKMAPYFPNGDVAAAPAHLTAAEFVIPYNNKLFYAGSSSSMVGWSDELPADSAAGTLPNFPSSNRQLIGSLTDGDSIMGLAVAYGHLIIFKRNSIYALSESSGVPSVTQIGRSVGLVAKFAFCNAENSVWFFGPSGVYSIGSDLTPEFESDYVLPDYQAVMNNFEIDYETYGGNNVPSINTPSFAYNQDKQQVWLSCYGGNGLTPARDVVYIHDLINKDASGRSAVSTYVFYQSSVRNYTPVLFCESTNPQTGRLELLSVSRKVEAAAANPEGVENPYHIYKHDVSVADGALGDDGNLVEFMWESKFFNLGDPMRLKALRYYTVFGDPRDEVSSLYTNQNYTYESVEQKSSRHEPMSVACRGAAAVCVGDYIYVFGGMDNDGHYLTSVRAYRISTNTWTTLVPTLSNGLAYAQAVYYNGKIYVIGGGTSAEPDGTKLIREFTITSPGALSATLSASSMSVAVKYHTAVVVGSKVYVFGGAGVSFFKSYDLTTLLFTEATLAYPAYYTSVYGAAAATLADAGTDYIFVFHHGSVLRYNVSANTWASSAAAGRPDRQFLGVYARGTSIFLVGGETYSDSVDTDGSPSASAYQYTPSFNAGFTGDTFTALSPFASPRSRFAGAYDSSSGLYYVLGGTGFPVYAYFSSTDDYKTYYTTEVEITLNQRSLVPPAINYLSRYWGIIFRGRISEGVARITGFCLDYIMFQRRG